MISKGFYEELEVIANERHLDLQDVFKSVETALIKACQLEGAKGEINIEFNEEQKKIRVFQTFHVVEEIDPEGPEGQILLDEAKEMRARVKVGQDFRTEISIGSIGRKGATRFKQIFIQSLKELSGKRAYEYFKDKEGEIITATIISVNNHIVVLNIGMDTSTILPIDETLPGESYQVGTQLKVCITKVEETGRGPKVFVSRTHRDIIKRLFETYIPEIASGVIEVIAIAREPGSRTKIGIKSNNINVDAKGACLGPSGSRIKQINEALNGEKIDIFEWNDNPIKLIAEALTPAKVISVLTDEEEKKCIAIVPDNQYSLAIGRGGQNARLASQVTGWKIDIKNEDKAYELGIKFKPNVYTI
ncbi:MAG: transcription termination factor NusA [Bacilli bacterium]|nr:transcription termination factor NusA [Mollicutes bacterium]MDY3899136.1 transcription termination factor NusA [Bacilli bacterium]